MPVTALKARSAVESLRDIVQDLLVPELKAIKAELDSQRREHRAEFDAIRTEMKLRDEKQTQTMQGLSRETRTDLDALRTQTRAEFDALRTEMKLRDEKQTQAIQALSDKVGVMIEVRERLAVLEDRARRD